ncbi:TonB-dependent receptor plug domain-containing protein [Roseateles oligotrophus]|uniref:TonB-dependent receptor n=1 Tax=Roseateles oligotrophus TaxID=1769250 RepID=A0ABT2YH69_9BURK|nr:TonB-dependent receptor [Roseateles oligotrophus]MCV2369325.1 TonB-dependent receptor [Roseateles oligotrophus]
MFQRKRINVAVLLALGSALSGVAMAQESLQRVEVTGSRIRTIDTESTSPIIVLSAESIRADGIRTAEGLLNNLPQVMADFGGSVSNGASGTATVNLRNLGSSRTLVLINGRRMPAGSPRNVAADLNQIPVSMIQRVEVLTGGASAVYGADAVAGVVNFILKDNFQGVEVDGSYQFFNHQQGNSVASIVEARGFALPGNKSADGKVREFNLTMGGNFADNKGNATINFTRNQTDALLQSERDFSSCALNPAGATFTCGGSSTSYPGRFFLNTGSRTVADANGTTRPFKAATDVFNFGPTNYFQRPSTRYSVTASAHFDINDKVRVYTLNSFHDDNTVAQIAPSGLFGTDFSGVNSIKFENPLLSADWKAQLHASNQEADTPTTFNKPGDTADLQIARRNVEGGGRQDHIRHTSYRTVTGVKGDIGAWSYDAFAQIGKVIYQETYKNDFSTVRIQRAMDVVADKDGKPVCRSFASGVDPNCVPYNIWSLGKVDPAAVKYLATPGFQKGYTEQQVLGASLAGDLTEYGIKLPTAKSGVGVAFGLERRTERLQLETDAAFTSGDLAGQGGPTIGTEGEYSVTDIFGEVRVPVFERMPLAYALNLNATYRHSNYSTGPKTNTWGSGLDWSPIKEVKVRGSYQVAVRAPNVVELFSSQAGGLFNMESDPCAGDKPTATAAQCANTGVTAAQYGKIVDSTAGQYNGLFGGNPLLEPETSNSMTFGVILNPIKDMTFSVDYFDIQIEKAIGSLPPDGSVNECLNTGNPAYCKLITRDSKGTLWLLPQAQVISTNINVAKIGTKGVDFGLDYGMRMGDMGKLDFSVMGTYLLEAKAETQPGKGAFDCAGYFGTTCGNPAPTWRHKLRGTWTAPFGLSTTLTWRYFGNAKNQLTSDDPQLHGDVAESQSNIKAVSYLDLAMGYKLTKNITLSASINNLLDKDPPVLNTGAPFGNGNTYPVVYDALGRRVTLGFNAKF